MFANRGCSNHETRKRNPTLHQRYDRLGELESHRSKSMSGRQTMIVSEIYRGALCALRKYLVLLFSRMQRLFQRVVASQPQAREGEPIACLLYTSPSPR